MQATLFLEYERETAILRRKQVATSIQRRAVDPSELAMPDPPKKPFEVPPPQKRRVVIAGRLER